MMDILISPFQEFAFMRQALMATTLLALGCAPIGCLLVLRRMSLVGDALAHAVLPGAAIGFVWAGLSLSAMSLGGFLGALIVALMAGFIQRKTQQQEDASFAALYLIALALGVTIVSLSANQIDVMHMLFGNVLAVDDNALLQIACVSSVTLLVLMLIQRPLIVDSFDSVFLKTMGNHGPWVHTVFLILLVANMVSAFQALGTLMSIGLMMLPAISARFWFRTLQRMIMGAMVIAVACGASGLLLSYYIDIPSGPSIVLMCGMVYMLSLLLGTHTGIMRHYWQRRSLHRTA